MALGVGCLGFAIQWFSQSSSVYSHGDTTALVLQVSSSVLGLSAAMAGAAPAVLAEGHRLFRCLLVSAHLLIAWFIQVVGYFDILQFGAEFIAALCVSSLVGHLGVFAGLAVGILVFAAMWGWRLTLREGETNRPTFSLRGILIATAVAALLFASPRIVTPPVTEAVNRIYDYFDLHSEPSATVISGEADPASGPLFGLVFGLVLASTLASAISVRRSRWGWVGLSTGAIAVGTFAFAVGSMAGSPAPPPGFAIVLAAALFFGSLQATLQTRLWEAFGWRLVRIRRGPMG